MPAIDMSIDATLSFDDKFKMRNLGITGLEGTVTVHRAWPDDDISLPYHTRKDKVLAKYQRLMLIGYGMTEREADMVMAHIAQSQKLGRKNVRMIRWQIVKSSNKRNRKPLRRVAGELGVIFTGLLILTLGRYLTGTESNPWVFLVVLPFYFALGWLASDIYAWLVGEGWRMTNCPDCGGTGKGHVGDDEYECSSCDATGRVKQREAKRILDNRFIELKGQHD